MASGIAFDAGPPESAVKYSAIVLIVPMLVVGAVSAASAQPVDPLDSWVPDAWVSDAWVPTRPVGGSNYWTDVLGPCYIPWYGPDYRHCGARTRRSAGSVYRRAARRSGGVAYRQSTKGRVAAY